MNKLIFAVVCALGASVAPAQQNVPTPVGQARDAEQVTRVRTTELQERLDAIAADTRARGTTRLSSTLTAEQQHDYNQWVLSYTQQAYDWHQRSTTMIFFMVVFVVASGVVLAAWQLHAWIARVKAYDRIFLQRLEKGLDVNEQIATEIGRAGGGEISVKENALALSSPYVGVVILGLSMGFFMAYLLYVYPILQGP